MNKKYLINSFLIGFRVFILGLVLACLTSTQLVSLASPSFHSLARYSPNISGLTPSNWGNEIGSVNLKNPLDQLATPKATNFPTNVLPQGQLSLYPSGNLVAPATITLQILATDSDGAVDTVEFFNGIQSLGFGLKNGSYWSLQLNNLVAGNYLFSAKVTDNSAGQNTFLLSQINVLPSSNSSGSGTVISNPTNSTLPQTTTPANSPSSTSLINTDLNAKTASYLKPLDLQAGTQTSNLPSQANNIYLIRTGGYNDIFTVVIIFLVTVFLICAFIFYRKKLKKIQISLTIIIVIFCSFLMGIVQSLMQPNQAFAQGNVFYVAKNGNDSNPGTLALPFLTIQKCAELATSGDICYVRAGVYRETVKPLNSGVTFSNFNGEITTVSGTEIIPNSTFSQHSGNIYKAPLSWSLNIRQPYTQSTNNQVFVDSNMQVEARWPNIPVENVTKITNISGITQDNARADSAQISSSTSASYTDLALTSAGSFWGQGLNKGKINFNPGFGINYTTCDIVSKITTNLSFGCNPDPGQGGVIPSFETTIGTMTAPKGNNYYYLWGKLEALDSAGEFFVDPPDNDSGQVTNQNGNYFSQGNYNLYLQMPDNSNPVSSGKVIEVRKRMYGFDLRNISSTSIHGINLFAASINTDKDTNSSTFDNLDIRYPWHTQELPPLSYLEGTVALPIRGSNNTLKNSYLAYAPGTMLSFAPAYEQTNSDNLAQNNVIQNVGYAGIGSGYTGSSSDPARKHQFLQNTIFNAGRNLIQAESAVDITHNDIYNSHLQITDLGAIYGWGVDGKGSNIAYNLVHDVHAEQNNDDLQFGGHGIYLDDETTDFNIYRNIVWQTTSPGLMLAGYRPWEQEYNPDKTNTRRLAYNNTIDGQLNFLNKCNGNVCGFQTGTEIKNNIFTGQTSAPSLDQAYGSVVLANNLFGNAQFNNAQNLDFGLQSTSPAVDTGQVIAPYTNNAVGLPDKGALERGANLVVAGAVARTTDLVNLSLNCQKNITTATCTISNLPLGRKIPNDFKIQIGNKLSIPNCLNQTNYNTNLTTATCSNIDLNSQTGLQPLVIQIGNSSQISKGNLDLGTITNPNPTIVLNEINYSGSTNSNTDQWLELYNNSSQTVDLAGYQVQGLGNATTPNINLNSSLCTNLNLPAGGYFLIAKYSKTNSKTNLNIDPDCLAPDLELGNSEKLRLYNAQAVQIDESL